MEIHGTESFTQSHDGLIFRSLQKSACKMCGIWFSQHQLNMFSKWMSSRNSEMFLTQGKHSTAIYNHDWEYEVKLNLLFRETDSPTVNDQCHLYLWMAIAKTSKTPEVMTRTLVSYYQEKFKDAVVSTMIKWLPPPPSELFMHYADWHCLWQSTKAEWFSKKKAKVHAN